MMINSLLKAYNTGKLLAMHKFAENNSEVKSEEDLTPILQFINTREPTQVIKSDVKNDSEKVEKASWGDKIELEPGSATGIEV